MTPKNKQLLLLQADAVGALLGIADMLRNHPATPEANAIAATAVVQYADRYLQGCKNAEGK